MVAGCGSSSPPPATTAAGTPAGVGSTSGSFDPALATHNKGAGDGAGATQNNSENATGAGALVGTTSSPPAKTTPAHTTSVASTPPAQTQTKAATTTKPKVITRTITVTRRTPPKTVIHYVTKKVLPDVPSGAFMPSSHQALAQARFTVPGSNIGCDLVSGGVRCDIQQRAWSAPAQPSSCNATWGNAIAMGATGVPAFACGGASAISSDAKVVPDGWDDKVGTITCQVRSFSVDCFSAHGHGFIFSRTGYTFY